MKYYTDTKTKSSKKLYLDTSMSMSLVPYYERVPINGPYDVSIVALENISVSEAEAITYTSLSSIVFLYDDDDSTTFCRPPYSHLSLQHFFLSYFLILFMFP